MVQYNGTPPRNQAPRLLEQVRVTIRAKHYSLRTEDTYVQWTRRFILFHDKRHPQAMGAAEVQQFLTDLAVTHQVAASTQNQALSALVFLYKEVLHHDFGWLDDVVRAKKPTKLPVVLTRDEVKRVFQHLSGASWLMASLLDGAGLRLMECLRLRIKDVDFATHQLTVREGKGAHDRVTMLPDSVHDRLEQHLHEVKQLHTCDLEGRVRECLFAVCLGAEIPGGRARLDLAICLSSGQTLDRPPQWHRTAAPCGAAGIATGGESGRAAG